MTTTIVHDTSEAVKLCASQGLYLKPIAKMTVSVALPQLKQPGKSISNWEVMERLKAMVHPDQFSVLRISKSTMEFIRFDGEVENKGIVKKILSKLDGKTIKLSGFSDILKVRAAEYKMEFPTRHDWDAFFRDAKDMNETLPGERPDTIHLEGLPCKWFASKDSNSEKPCESILKTVFETFGKIRNVDIPMLDPYREDMMDKNFHTFSFGGHLNFEGYVQYQEYIGFVKAMDALRGMKLMFIGEDGKAVACNIKVLFDTTKHLSETAIRKRQLERQKLQELERQREENKRKEKEEAERLKEEERKRKEQEEEEKERKREEKLHKREQKQREREEKKNLKKFKKMQAEEQKKLHQKIVFEERKLLLAKRNLESIRLIAELLSRAKAMKQQEMEKQKAEKARLQLLEEKRRQQEAELRRVEEEKSRALELQRREKELREKLLGNLLKKNTGGRPEDKEEPRAAQQLRSIVNISGIHSGSEQSTPGQHNSPALHDTKANGTSDRSAVNGSAVNVRNTVRGDILKSNSATRSHSHGSDDGRCRKSSSRRHSSRERSRYQHSSNDRSWRPRKSSDENRQNRRDRRDSGKDDSPHQRGRRRHYKDSSRERSQHRRHSRHSRHSLSSERNQQHKGRPGHHRGGSWD
ncbi:A-kinase anchor protein 17A-like [Acipenser ruthenus]|uniref:A-kinase anchor protein 17A-like n=1 Tax=Acipenser ruthenus TaxID=7906 RepID=UPI00145B59C4|nr:A-kinase anchor protein 17A-like [Acipenser ruthenus]XP_034779324.1 A-kinase anchor protein 17A-like [Acipenser ruthenus]